MIIVNQDKTEIVNFNNLDSIWICSDEEGRFTIEATADTNTTLGCYETEEKAKKVLAEIIQKTEDLSLTNLMENLEIAIHDVNFDETLSNTFYMPEE